MRLHLDNTYILKPSTRDNKKFLIITPENTKIHFGDSRYQDFTMHKNIDRKELYIQRHQAREDWNNLNTAGFWSRWLLWEKPTLNQAINFIQKKFNISINIED